MTNTKKTLKPPFEIVRKENHVAVIQEINPDQKSNSKNKAKIKSVEKAHVILHLFDPAEAAKLTAIGEQIQDEWALQLQGHPFKRYLNAFKDFLIS